MDKELQIKEFTKFYHFLMKNTLENYKPWFFPCEPKGKNPSPSAILKIDASSKGSWHHESARLNFEQCIEHIKLGYNIGISAREGDPLIIGDIDEVKYLNQLPEDTLTVTSRKRGGAHFFGWDKDRSAKINLPTDSGEMRSNNQYVLAPGSYVPFDLTSKKDKKAFDNLPIEAREDKLIGYYTVREGIQPKGLTFNDLPKFFKDKEMENIEVEAKIKQADEKKEFHGEGKYTDLLKLKVSDIVGLIPSNKRQGHPLHESDTDANFSLSKDGSLGHCWRHLVSLNAVQYLCVKCGYAKCEDAGTPHKGRGFSKIKGDKKALAEAYKEAVKMGLIKEQDKEKKDKKDNKRLISCYVDEDDKQIAEQVWDKKNGSRFCIYDDNTRKIEYVDGFEVDIQTKYYPQEGEEIEKGAVLLPSEAIDYVDDITLDKKILAFIHKWLDIPAEMEQFGLWNTKLSWVYQQFHTLNYSRALGDTGTGKSRFLDTLGYIHYKPIFTTGSTTPAPLFRVIDKWKGTVVMDEADLKKSDEGEQIIKIINQGFERGRFIMRCDQNDANKINFFDPFCPKILATRKTYSDKAVESRCITHVCSSTDREDIILNLNEDFFKEALEIRNMLLMWRFKNYFKINKSFTYNFGDIEPRLKQIIGGYATLFSHDEKQMEKFKVYIKEYQEELIDERQSSFDGSIVGAIHSLLEKGKTTFTVKDIIIEGDFTGNNGKPLQPRALSSHLRSLGFKKGKLTRVNGFSKKIIPLDKKHLEKVFLRYGFDCNCVTVVTVVTDIYDYNNSSRLQQKIPNVTVGGGLHSNGYNGYTVTDTNFKNSGIQEAIDG